MKMIPPLGTFIMNGAILWSTRPKKQNKKHKKEVTLRDINEFLKG